MPALAAIAALPKLAVGQAGEQQPSVATSAYGIAGSGSGRPPASVRHSPSRQA
jgi:hypothetical protein